MASYTCPFGTVSTSLFFLAVALIASGAPVGAQSYLGLTGTPHDFMAGDWGGVSTSEAGSEGSCRVCHMPGRSNDLDSTGEGGFALYGGGAGLGSTDPGMVSQLCMGCHDGMSATAKYMGRPGGGSHPIATDYDEFENRGLRSISAVEGDGLRLFRSSGRARVECSSCHDPHDNRYGNFLRMSNAGSRLCFTCHDK